METSPTVKTPRLAHSVPFHRIVCAVDGSRSALEAVRQAGALAGPGSSIELLAVGDNGVEDQLLKAAAALPGSPADVTTRTVAGTPVWAIILDEAREADLLAIGRHGHSRVAGIAHGSTATNVIHRSSVPLLVADKPPDGATFPGHILVAADGPGHPEDAVRVAGQIAAHARAGDVTMLRLDWSRRARSPELAEALAELTQLTGCEPVEIIAGGSPSRLIPEMAERHSTSLVVMGTRGLSGLRAVRSVSERVAHEAPCSVLIVHAPEVHRD